jgi:acyl-CoA synthetase (NDP forming)
MAEVLAKQPRLPKGPRLTIIAKQPRLPKGPRLTIITNAGGPGVLATDALINTGGELAELSLDTIARSPYHRSILPWRVG